MIRCPITGCDKVYTTKDELKNLSKISKHPPKIPPKFPKNFRKIAEKFVLQNSPKNPQKFYGKNLTAKNTLNKNCRVVGNLLNLAVLLKLLLGLEKD